MKCPQKTAEGADLIIAYAAHSLAPADEAAFEHHLELCANCREMAAEQRTVWAVLDELPALPVSPDFDSRLYQRIAAEQQMAWWQRLLRAEWSWRPVVPLAAAGAVLIVAFLVKSSEPSVLQPQPAQPQLQIEQVERALDDMDMLKQAGVEATLEKGTPQEQI